MSLTRELIDQEALMVQGGERGVIHLHREGSFYRSYEWSAYLLYLGDGEIDTFFKNFLWKGKEELDLHRKTSTMSRRARKPSTIGIYHVMLRGINRQDMFLEGADYLFF